MLETFFLLIAAHFLCDFALQSEFMAIYKSPRQARVGGEIIWPWLLGGHAAIHGLAVFLVTGSLLLGLAETSAHALIDYLKCKGRFGFHVDQLLHIGSKVLWLVVYAFSGSLMSI
jgi:hypothetical protein